MGKYRKFGETEHNDDILTELDKSIEVEEEKERNPFALYEGEEHPDTEKATQEIKNVIDKFTSELSSVMSKWEKYGADETASRDAIIYYISENM